MFKHILYTGLTQAVLMMLPLIMTPIFVSTLGDERYGFYSLLVTTCGLFFMLSNLGLGFTARRELPSSESLVKNSQLFYPQFYSNVLITCFFALLVFLVVHGYFKSQVDADWPTLTPVILGYLLLFSVFSQFSLLFKFKQKFSLLNGFILSHNLFNAFLLFFSYFYYGDLTISIIFLCNAISLFLVILIFFIPVIKIVGKKPYFYNKKTLVADFRLGFPLLLLAGLELFIAVSDRYVIAYFLDLQAVSAYAISAMLCSLLLVIPRFLSLVVEPKTSRLVDQGSIFKVKEMTQMLLYGFLAIGLPAVCLSYLLGTSILSIYISGDIGLEAGNSVWVLMLGSTLFGLVMLLNSCLLSFRKTKRLFYVNLIAAGTNGVLNLVIFNFYADIMVAAVTTLISYIVLLILTVKSVQSVAEIKIIDGETVRIVICSLGSFFLVQKLQLSVDSQLTLLGLLSVGSIYIVTYLGSMFLLSSKVISMYHWKNLNQI
jgi:O-antigen/teichoic acid export membrane protein